MGGRPHVELVRSIVFAVDYVRADDDGKTYVFAEDYAELS